MGINYQLLIDAVRDYNHKYGRGAKAKLAEQSGLDPNIITKIINGKTTEPQIKTWDALFDAFPEEIPRPEFDRDYGNSDPNGSAIHTCPLFGIKNKCSELLNNHLNMPFHKNTCFTVILKDNAMAPKFKQDDIAIVDTAAKLKNGNLVFLKNVKTNNRVASLRWYASYGDIMVLRSENTIEYPDIVLKTKEEYELYKVNHVICSYIEAR